MLLCHTTTTERLWMACNTSENRTGNVRNIRKLDQYKNSIQIQAYSMIGHDFTILKPYLSGGWIMIKIHWKIRLGVCCSQPLRILCIERLLFTLALIGNANCQNPKCKHGIKGRLCCIFFIFIKWMLALEARCIPLVKGGVLIIVCYLLSNFILTISRYTIRDLERLKG